MKSKCTMPTSFPSLSWHASCWQWNNMSRSTKLVFSTPVPSGRDSSFQGLIKQHPSLTATHSCMRPTASSLPRIWRLSLFPQSRPMCAFLQAWMPLFPWFCRDGHGSSIPHSLEINFTNVSVSLLLKHSSPSHGFEWQEGLVRREVCGMEQKRSL